ncbi:helix-turn-helix domain-containing protein [Streptomyces sp. SP18BB07]|uniref:helix-turn-helix domain-containing protein n=1 Tax=Streptomyces sp. SP18BB07 TaxID=3002522 RepID=UPI002E7A86BC|nr:helix-turn-helix domain-containing protein [Streptomyces sp. SP18BB07]MEE1764448.1 helix-turn-helix domain-containing protein [Streptomyces sp. SP18BB07]
MSTTQIRAALNARADLRPVERLVLVQLGDFAGPDGVAFPTAGRLAEAANVSVATIARVLDRLAKLGLIERTASHTATGATAPTVYRVIGNQA